MIEAIKYWYIRNFIRGVFRIELKSMNVLRKGDTIMLLDNKKLVYLGKGKFKPLVS